MELFTIERNKTIHSLLSKLSVSEATGLDKISARLLRVCPDLIADSLCSIFNRSINTGIFPEKWKCSKVVPLIKEGVRKDLNNYRPITIIPIVAKVFERIIYDQVNTFLVDNGLLFNSQGFDTTIPQPLLFSRLPMNGLITLIVAILMLWFFWISRKHLIL